MRDRRPGDDESSPGQSAVPAKCGTHKQILEVDARLAFPGAEKVTEVDLHPDKVTNVEMGYQ